jgi:hypothetical protein
MLYGNNPKGSKPLFYSGRNRADIARDMMAQNSARRQTGGEPPDVFAVGLRYFITFGQMPPVKRDVAAARVTSARRLLSPALRFDAPCAVKTMPNARSGRAHSGVPLPQFAQSIPVVSFGQRTILTPSDSVTFALSRPFQ